jgi:hypothetical protein
LQLDLYVDRNRQQHDYRRKQGRDQNQRDTHREF